MAARSLGASNTQILSLKLSQKTKICMPFLPHGIKARSKPIAWSSVGVMVSQRSNRTGIVCRRQSSLFTENEHTTSIVEEGVPERSCSAPVRQLIPTSEQVISLLTEICDTTSIAEFELKLNGFHLHVRRSSSGMDPSPPASASINANSGSEMPTVNGSVSTPSLAIAKAGALEGEPETMLERADDEEGLVIIQSPKVGFFRRSRTIKGKRAPPACKENQAVKEGQVIFYIDQLGCETPVESDVSGEVKKILREDGEPVGYGDAIIAFLPEENWCGNA